MALTPELRAWLRDDLAPLSTLRAGLAERALTWVVDGGDDASLLSELLLVHGAGRVLKLVAAFPGVWGPSLHGPGTPTFLGAMGDVDPRALYRLARVYNAATMADPRRLDHPALPDWLEVLLQEALAPHEVEPTEVLSAEAVEAMLARAGLPADTLARAALGGEDKGGSLALSVYASFGFCRRVRNFRAYLERHPQAISDALQAKGAAALAGALGALFHASVSIEPWRRRIVDLAVGPQKTVREAAQSLLRSDAEASFGPLAEVLSRPSRNERLQAVTLLLKLGKESALEVFRETLERERDEEVRAAMQAHLWPAVSPSPPGRERAPQVERPLTAETRAALHDMLAKVHAAAHVDAPYPSVHFLAPLDEALVDAAFRAMQTDGTAVLRTVWMQPAALRHVLAFVERPDLDLPHVVRLALALNLLRRTRRTPFDEFLTVLEHRRRARGADFGLDDVAQVLESCFVSSLTLLYSDLTGWEDDAVWPFLERHLDALAAELEAPPERYELTPRRPQLFAMAARFPTPPPALVPILWDVALGASRTERPLAQRALARLPDLDKRLLEALSSTRQHVRAEAASWLARRGVAEARPALLAAMKREKVEVVRDEMMGALERLGTPVDQLVDLKKLLADTEKATVPAALAWFPFDGLPAVRWLEGGDVPPALVRFLVVQACGRKSPQPGASLRRLCAWFQADDRQALGQHVLKAWIAQDTVPANTPDEAVALAEKQAKAMHGWVGNERTYEQLYRSSLDFFLSQCAGSAVGEKGVLAVAAACGGDASVRLATAYVTRWYGNRAAQCKALVAMLAWMESPLAVQFLLRTASGFRTRGIQEEAAAQVALLAERNGWSVDDLADRTVPRGGLDEAGDLALDYGPRTFRAHLVDSGDLVLEDADGRLLKALPDARGDDDPTLVDEARKRLAAARKECKALLKAQAERLYLAMCTERTWSVADWRAFVLGHPIVGSLARRLVWIADDGRTLRPTPDGTLLEAAEDEVELADTATVRLAHGCMLTSAQVAAWRAHLADHRVSPPFEQLEGSGSGLRDDQRYATSMRDFEGHMADSLKLRGRATKLGWQRGPTGDGGWFTEYVKRFGDFEARVSFSGNQLPEQSREVALEALTFVHGGREVSLGEVPRVLLATAADHLRQMAAVGRGYDADWRTRVQG